MPLLGLVILLLVALLMGSIAQALVGGTRGGCLVSIAVGLIGALIGGYLSRALDAPNLLVIGNVDVVWGTIGAVLFLVVLRLLVRR